MLRLVLSFLIKVKLHLSQSFIYYLITGRVRLINRKASCVQIRLHTFIWIIVFTTELICLWNSILPLYFIWKSLWLGRKNFYARSLSKFILLLKLSFIALVEIIFLKNRWLICRVCKANLIVILLRWVLRDHVNRYLV